MLDRTRMHQVQRWHRAAQRALAADLPARLRRRGGAVLVPSRSTDGRAYHVRLSGERVGACDCEAALMGQPCSHRAAVALRLYERETGTRVVAVKPAAVTMLARYLGGGVA
jgi:hypothetical protein